MSDSLTTQEVLVIPTATIPTDIEIEGQVIRLLPGQPLWLPGDIAECLGNAVELLSQPPTSAPLPVVQEVAPPIVEIPQVEPEPAPEPEPVLAESTAGGPLADHPKKAKKKAIPDL